LIGLIGFRVKPQVPILSQDKEFDVGSEELGSENLTSHHQNNESMNGHISGLPDVGNNFFPKFGKNRLPKRHF